MATPRCLTSSQYGGSGQSDLSSGSLVPNVNVLVNKTEAARFFVTQTQKSHMLTYATFHLLHGRHRLMWVLEEGT